MDEQLQNQLARRLGLLLTPQDSITDETLVKLVLFLATEYDRGKVEVLAHLKKVHQEQGETGLWKELVRLEKGESK